MPSCGQKPTRNEKSNALEAVRILAERHHATRSDQLTVHMDDLAARACPVVLATAAAAEAAAASLLVAYVLISALKTGCCSSISCRISRTPRMSAAILRKQMLTYAEWVNNRRTINTRV